METTEKPVITVQVAIKAQLEKGWTLWTSPEHIKKWNSASDDWHTTTAENDLRAGGKFLSRMEAKDGSFGFDFWGIYQEVVANQLLAYTLGDGRKVKVTFMDAGDQTLLEVSFEAESQNPVEMQRSGWQAILNNFKKYSETL